jgi:hypothetical protein
VGNEKREGEGVFDDRMELMVSERASRREEEKSKRKTKNEMMEKNSPPAPAPPSC